MRGDWMYDRHARYRGGRGGHSGRDDDRHGIWNRRDRDRDGDGVRNSRDFRPNTRISAEATRVWA